MIKVYYINISNICGYEPIPEIHIIYALSIQILLLLSFVVVVIVYVSRSTSLYNIRNTSYKIASRVVVYIYSTRFIVYYINIIIILHQ